MPESKKPSRKRSEKRRISKCIFLFEKWKGKKKRCGKKQRWCVDDERKERKQRNEIYPGTRTPDKKEAL